MSYGKRRGRYGYGSRGDRFGMFNRTQIADDSTAGLRRMHFASASAYLEWIDTQHAAHPERGADCWSAYAGDEWNARKGADMLQVGDDARGQRFAEMADQFSEDVYVEQRTWRPQVSGAFVNVGAFLAGRPDCMWERTREMGSREPVRIWVGLTSSAGVSPADLERRGAALCAFAIALSVTRPVLITPYAVLGGRSGVGAIVSYDLSAPLVLSEIAAAVATPSVTRGLGIAACYLAQPECYGAWWRDYDNPERMREQLGCAPQDVYLGSIHMGDPLLRDPVQWIKENLSHLTSDRSDYADAEE